MIFVYNERQGVRDGQTVMASCLYIYGDRSAHGTVSYTHLTLPTKLEV